MVKLQTITDKSWLVFSEGGIKQPGLLSEQQDKYTFIVNKVKTSFNGREEVVDFFSEDVFDEDNMFVEDGESMELFVNGYPINCESPHFSDAKSDYPLFTKTERSGVQYAAGFYCVRFPGNWVSVCCPKLSTLEKYDHKGPYKLETDMQIMLSTLRKCLK